MTMTTSTELFDDQKKRFSDFAQKDYKLKIQYLTNHFQRMWTRFNYFVVIEAALIGGKTIFGDKTISVAGLCFGLALSLVWYVMGAEDRFLVQVYRDQLNEAASFLTKSLWPFEDRQYQFVGDLEGAGESFKTQRSGLERLSAWRIESISTTRLAALIPLAVSLVWLGLLIYALVDQRP